VTQREARTRRWPGALLGLMIGVGIALVVHPPLWDLGADALGAIPNVLTAVARWGCMGLAFAVGVVLGLFILFNPPRRR
jgi:hypothetical protein